MLTRFMGNNILFLINIHDFRMFTKRGFGKYNKKFDYYGIFKNLLRVASWFINRYYLYKFIFIKCGLHDHKRNNIIQYQFPEYMILGLFLNIFSKMLILHLRTSLLYKEDENILIFVLL